MTVKEFIEKNPKDGLDLMTPGGFVFLNHERCQDLLRGVNVQGHPGVSGSEFTMEIEADDLLSQDIISVGSREGNVWCFTTGYPDEHRLPVDADPMERLQTRLYDRYRAYEAEQQMLEPHEVFEKAREIAATQEIYEALKDGSLCGPYLDSLLREDDPLTAVRDRWMDFNNVDQSQELQSVLFQLEQEQEQAQGPTMDSPC